MTQTTDQERAEFEALANGRCELHLVNPAGRYSSAITQFAWEAWQAARRTQVVPQLEPVEGDQLPPVGSRIFIRHGRDDDAHACIVTGYYVWGDLKGDKRLHRVFVRMVYEGTQTQNARMLCDCYKTEAEALAATPQQSEGAVNDSLTAEAAPVQMPESISKVLEDCHSRAIDYATCPSPYNHECMETAFQRLEHQVRQLLAAHAHGITQAKQGGV